MSIHSPLPQFRELRFVHDYSYQLDWFGGIYANPQDPGNPLIECLLTPIKPREQDTNSSKVDYRTPNVRKISEQVRVGIGVGNLSNLFPGRIVRDGKFLAEIPAEVRLPERITFEIDTSNAESSHEGFLSDYEFEKSHALVSDAHVKLGVRSPIKLLRGKLMSSNSKGVPQEGKTWTYGGLGVVIHELELIRFYYTNSSNLSRAVFSGAFASDRLRRTIISDESNAYGYDVEQDTHFFVHRIGFDDGDMPILGRILFEPEDLALKGVRRISTSLLASGINNSKNRTGNYARTYFPFKQKTQLTLVGHRARLVDGTYLFVVHRIERCTAEFPFRNLNYLSIRTVATGPSVLEPVDWNKPSRPRVKGPVNTVGQQLEAQNRSDIPPSTDSIQVAREAGIRVYAGLGGTNLQRLIRHSDRPKSDRRLIAFDPALTDLSTGRPGHRRTSAAKLTVRERIERGQLTVDLTTFIKAIAVLQDLAPDWEISSIQVGDTPWIDPETGVYRGYFPLVNCPIRQSVLFKFSYLDDERSTRRQLIGVEISVQNARVYLFEAQRRTRVVVSETGDKKTPYADELPVLIVWRDDFSPTDSDEFVQLLKATVSNVSKTWPAEIDGFHRSSVHHLAGDDVPSQLAERIKSTVSKIFSEADSLESELTS